MRLLAFSGPVAAYGAVFLSVLAATMLMGLTAGVAVAVVGWISVIVWVVEPVGTFRIEDDLDLAAAVFLPAASFFTAVIFETVRVAFQDGGSDRPST